VGKPEDKPPKAVDIVWNLDAVTPELKEYQMAANKLRSIYIEAMPESTTKIASESDNEKFVEELFKKHPKAGSVKFWRVLVTSVIKKYDAQTEGEVTSTEEIYHDVMDQLREE